MNIEFRFLTPKRLNDTLNILKEFFGANYYGADPHFFNWQYRDSPFKSLVAGKDEYSVLLAMEDDTILALDAFLPWQTVVNGRNALTFWDIEWINVGKVRGMGRKLVSEIRSQCEVYCGYGMNSLSWTAYEQLGYQLCQHIERMVAVIDAAACNALFNTDGDAKRSNFLKHHEVPVTAATAHLITNVADLSDRYWESQLERCAGTSYKGRDYLKWRFLEHPYLHYHLITEDPQGNSGVAAVRMEKIKNHDAKVLRVLDMLPVEGHAEALTQAVISFGRTHGAILADFFCASSRYAQQVCPSPFIPLGTHEPHEIPMLFQPIEVRERKSINMVLDTNPPFKDLTFDSFYCTKADGDQDVYLNEDYTTVLI